MNRKNIIILIIFISILICIFVLNKKEKPKKEIPIYKSDLVCKLNNNDNNIIYVFYDSNKNVTKAIYHVIENENTDIELTKSIFSIYNRINGVEASIEKIGDKVLEEIIYDYSKIDIIEAKNILSDITNNNILLKQVDRLPFNYSFFKEKELNNYECE